MYPSIFIHFWIPWEWHVKRIFNNENNFWRFFIFNYLYFSSFLLLLQHFQTDFSTTRPNSCLSSSDYFIWHIYAVLPNRKGEWPRSFWLICFSTWRLWNCRHMPIVHTFSFLCPVLHKSHSQSLSRHLLLILYIYSFNKWVSTEFYIFLNTILTKNKKSNKYTTIV